MATSGDRNLAIDSGQTRPQQRGRLGRGCFAAPAALPLRFLECRANRFDGLPGCAGERFERV